MNGNERSTPRDFDPETAPDLSAGEWPEKFAKAPVRRGRPPVASPQSVHDYPTVARRAGPLQGRRARLADADQQGATRVDPAPGSRLIVPCTGVKAAGRRVATRVNGRIDRGLFGRQWTWGMGG